MGRIPQLGQLEKSGVLDILQLWLITAMFQVNRLKCQLYHYTIISILSFSLHISKKNIIHHLKEGKKKAKIFLSDFCLFSLVSVAFRCYLESFDKSKSGQCNLYSLIQSNCLFAAFYIRLVNENKSEFHLLSNSQKIQTRKTRCESITEFKLKFLFYMGYAFMF